MKAIEINQHFLSRASWLDPAKTVDRVIVGDPQKEVRRLLVTWIASFRAVRAAVERGFDMLMTHEPSFWVHANELEKMERSEIASAKRLYIEQSGLVVLRNHDAWDRWPEVGIPWAWGQFLGLGGKPVATGAGGYQHRYDVEPVALDEFAARVARRTAAIGESAVQVVGDGKRLVSHVGIGTGCACDIRVFQEMGCDVSIVCDDGSCYWGPIQRAEDGGHAVIRVNHGTSEEPGMMTLTRYINEALPGVEAEHLPHGATFRLVG